MVSCIIFLKGVSIDDYKNIEDEFNERLLENISTIDPYKTDLIKYSSIPPIFNSIDTWAKCTNLHCWNCDFTFNNFPIFIPTTIRRCENKWVIQTYGNFCSFSCACRYGIDHMTEDVQFNLTKLYNIIYNVYINKLSPSPRRHLMMKYGGYMSDEIYLTTIKKLNQSLNSPENIIRETYSIRVFRRNIIF